MKPIIQQSSGCKSQLRPRRVLKLSTAAALTSCIALMPGQLSTAAASSKVTPSDGDLVAAWSQIVPSESGGLATEQASVEARFAIYGTDLDACQKYGFEYKSKTKKGIATPTLNARVRATKLTGTAPPQPVDLPLTRCSYRMPAAWESATLKEKDSSGKLKVAATVPVSSFQETNGSSSNQSTVVTKAQPVTFVGPHSIGRKHLAKNEIRMVTLGDTGCKIQSGQNCNWSSTKIHHWWPFPNIIQSAANAEPDLVIHVGDFRYYNENVTPDTWHYWYQDFFKPAQALLLKAPWAFSRGNHEQCIDTSGKIWYGAGFLFLFGIDTQACTDPATQPDSKNLKTWHFDVAVGGIDAGSNPKSAHRFVMIDTSNGGNSAQGNHFDDAVTASNGSNGSWWVSHIPAITLEYYAPWGQSHKSPQTGDKGVAQAQRDAFMGQTPCSNGTTPPCNPSTVLLGHQHMFQQVEFFDPSIGSGDYVWPQSYIVGHGGVKLRTPGYPSNHCTFKYFQTGNGKLRQGWVTNKTHFGYVVWKRDASTIKNGKSGWHPEPKDALGNTMSIDTPLTGACLQGH